MDSFLGFVVLLIAWLIVGSIGATWLTKKGYLEPEARPNPRPMYLHRTTAVGVSSQYFAAVLGPLALVAALILPAKH
jgi:hypothetical protein